jgi:glycosyltransferase involved in cell wall biosynthesis
MQKLDVLAYKMDSYDTEDLIDKIKSYSQNSIILIFDFDKIFIKYKGNCNSLKDSTWKFHRINNKYLMNLLLPFLFSLDILMMLKIFFGICFKYRPRIFWTENVYAAFIAGILRKFGLCNKLIYVPGDWLVNTNNKKLWSYLANNIMFPILDYFACRFSSVVLYGNERLRTAREIFWGRKIARKEKLCPFIQLPGISLKTANIKKTGKTMCFLGDRRLDSGLDIAIKALPGIREHYDIMLKAIGPVRDNDDYFKDLAKDLHVTPFVKFYGYLDSHDLEIALEDCFCGLNILTDNNSYSYYGFPGKQVHYLQHLLPIILTEGAGSFVPVVLENSLGMITEPSVNAFRDVAIQLYKRQQEYRNNIIQFITNVIPIRIEEIMEA